MTLRIGNTHPSSARHSISGPGSSGANIEIRLIGDLAVLRNGEALALPNSRETRSFVGGTGLAHRPA